MTDKDAHEPSPESLEPTRRQGEASVDVDATVVSPPAFEDATAKPNRDDQTVPFAPGDAPVHSKKSVEATQLGAPDSAALGERAPEIPRPPPPREAAPEDAEAARTSKVVLLGLVGGATLVFTLLSLRSCSSSSGEPPPTVSMAPLSSTAEHPKTPGRFKAGEKVRVVVGDGLQGATILEADGTSYLVRFDSGGEEKLGEGRIAGRSAPAPSPELPAKRPPAPPRSAGSR